MLHSQSFTSQDFTLFYKSLMSSSLHFSSLLRSFKEQSHPQRMLGKLFTLFQFNSSKFLPFFSMNNSI